MSVIIVGGSLKARGSSRILLVDDGFFVAQAISLSKACLHACLIVP